MPIYSPKDGGPYITAGVVVSENLETGIPDIGNYRMQIHGPRELGVFSASNHRFGKNIAHATQLGKQLRGALPRLAHGASTSISISMSARTTTIWIMSAPSIGGRILGRPHN